jgi:DNA modification methylase
MDNPMRNTLSSQQTLAEQLKAKGRRRRETLTRMAAPGAAPRPPRNDLLPALELVHLPPQDLIVPSRNVRAQDPARVREVAASISALGFCDPVLIDAGRMIIDGVTTVEASKLLGLPNIPCVVIPHLKPAERRLLRIALNRLQEKGAWDLDALKIEFQELIVEDMPIEITGFSGAEIDVITMDDDADAAETGPLAPLEGTSAVSRPGDIFLLGPHRVICGDATDLGVFHALMQSETARLILTDEPYNVPIAGHVTHGSRHREFAMASGEMSDHEFASFNADWMEACLAYLREGGIFATFIDWRGYPIVHGAAVGLGLGPLNLVVWSKTNAGMGSLYRSQHELLPLFKKGTDPHVNNVELGSHGRWRSNVWSYAGASTMGSDARRGLQEHPTVKPAAMLADALLDVTERGDIVLDPFLGSGSTLVAAEMTGRVCRGVEIDPLYVDVVIRRYQALAGRSAMLQETGETFAELTGDRQQRGQ